MPGVDWFIQLAIVILIVGGLLYIIERFPIDATLKIIVKVAALVGVGVWLLLSLKAVV